MPRRRTVRPGVHIEEMANGIRPVTASATSVAAFVDCFEEGPIDKAVEIRSRTEFDRTFGGLNRRSEASYAVAQFFRNGGDRAFVVRVVTEDGVMPGPSTETEHAAGPALATALLGDEAAKKGLYALEDADLFNILCIPLAAKLEGNEMDKVVREALTFCERKRAFMIVDIPAGVDDVGKVAAWIGEHSDLRHANAAAYFPRLTIADPEDEYRPRSIGTGGTVAGIFARMDASRGVWHAPAGLEARLRGDAKPDCLMTDAEQRFLNTIGINGIRVFPVHGRVVWGARTLAGTDSSPTERKYVPIRRLALLIEESVRRGTSWVGFEPNGEPTWAKIRQSVGAFMMNLFRQGAFRGAAPGEAFHVKCDAETTPAADRRRGLVNFVVGFAPVRADEFVEIGIQLRCVRS